MTPLQTILEVLDDVRKSGAGWSAKCPAHEDRRNSLSIAEGSDGKVLLYCHAGCDLGSILAAHRLSESDLFPPKDPGGRRIVAEYSYVDEDGAELFQAVRFHPKDFRQRHREKSGAWTWNLNGTRRVLYRLPELLDGVKNGRTIHVVEGEKDVEAIRSLGLVATTSPMGAGKWRAEYGMALVGARVVIIADADAPGRKHAAAVEASLRGKAASVRVVEVPTGKDASDWVAAGATREDFGKLDGRESGQEHRQEGEQGQGPEEGEAVDGFELTDTGNSERFAARFGNRIRFVPEFGEYLVFEDGRLVLDVGAVRTLEMTRMVTREMRASGDMRIAGFGVKSEKRSARENMRVLAQSLPGLAVPPSALDADPWMLSCPNGLVDLRTGEMRAARLEDLVTKRTGAQYVAGAPAPRWRRFIAEVTVGDVDLEGYLQRTVGYSLTGCTGEQVFFFLYGDGANGKGTFVKVLQRALGDYAGTLKTEALMAQYGQAHPTELVPLFGSRFVTANEVPDGRSWNEARLKELTGEDRLTARRMHENFWTFEPTHKLWISGNCRPRVHGDDFGLWRRVRVIPFEARFAVNQNLLKELLTELPGVLAWAVEGSLAWQRDGLGLPERVRRATADYQERENVVGQFVEEACYRNEDLVSATADLYGGFTRWCERTGERPPAKRGFSDRLERLGFKRSGNKNSRGFIGIGLMPVWVRVDEGGPE
jgi:putative DNA primase/helicase